jgi:hypothetical protein
MTKPIKEMFRNILDEWDSYWRDSIEFVDFLNDYVEINDDQRTYVVKKRKHEVEVEE